MNIIAQSPDNRYLAISIGNEINILELNRVNEKSGKLNSNFENNDYFNVYKQGTTTLTCVFDLKFLSNS